MRTRNNIPAEFLCEAIKMSESNFQIETVKMFAKSMNKTLRKAIE